MLLQQNTKINPTEILPLKSFNLQKYLFKTSKD